MLIRDLAIELLTQDGGISQEAYEILHGMLDGDLDITGHVEATDGRFYLPDGWEPDPDETHQERPLVEGPSDHPRFHIGNGQRRADRDLHGTDANDSTPTAITAELARRLRFCRGLTLPVDAEYETPRLKSIALLQSVLLVELQRLDEELLTIV